MYNYGTAGFRYNSTIIEKIAFKIGKGLVLCALLTNNTIGVMITASHNNYNDNGIKITDNNGRMISKDLEDIMTHIVNLKYIRTYNYISNFFKKHKNIIELNPIINIVIGQDTRNSGENIKNLIIDGINSIYDYINIIDLQKVTTPEHHYYVNNMTCNFIEKNYIDKYTNIYSKLYINHQVIVDCANGVGYLTLAKIIKLSNKESFVNMINTNISNYKKLNYKCGSDYIMNNLIKQKINHLETNKLYVSFDGDCDRIICYFKENDILYLLDGDHISALIIYYINTVLKISEIDVIHTCYSNDAFINWVKKQNIKTKCCPTGVKYLDKEARNKKIGIYFEYNGHGTCLFNNISFTELFFLRDIFNQVVGDGIATLAGILFILNENNIKLIDWYNLYKKNNCIHDKIIVKDKLIYKTNDLGTKLLQPNNIVEQVENIINNENIKCIIRPSGTEDILRIYIEGYKSDDKLNKIMDKIKRIIT